MPTWVIYHISPLIPEIAVEDVPDGVSDTDIRNALFIGEDFHCSVNPDISFLTDHGGWVLRDAPQNVQEAYKTGKVKVVRKWDTLWKSTT